MFWKQHHRQKATNFNDLDASEIVSQVSGIYADLNDQDQLVKPRSSLPCPLFTVRECFMTAYEKEYLQLSEKLRNSYHHVYRELAFFVDDELYNKFNASLNIAVKCRFEQEQKYGISQTEDFYRKLIASSSVTIQNRKAIWESLANEKTCPRHDLILLAETLSYCSESYRALWDEWAAFSNLVAYRKKTD